jgi:subtilisin-like proprotein convertase family protein
MNFAHGQQGDGAFSPRRCAKRGGRLRGRIPLCEELEDRRLLTASACESIVDDAAIVSDVLASSMALVDAQSDPHATPQAGTASPQGYSPAQMRHAYGFDQIFFEGGSISGDGTGQTIAIVNAFHTPTALDDLQAFSTEFGLPMPPSFTQVGQTGGAPPAGTHTGWALETALDIQWAHALAPGANILLVEANTDSFTNLGIALDYARGQPGVSIISMSWGALESDLDASFESGFNSHFATPTNHANVAFFAAAGNSGNPGLYPAHSNVVMGVGGTTLSLDAQGNILGESSWGGGGGGVSQFQSQPTWQNGVVSAYSTTMRTLPDVAFLANPNTGVSVYDSFNNGTVTPWRKIAGTSFATPSWGALVAIADQGRNLAGLPVLDIPELMSMIYAMPASNFNDITINGGPPANPAGPGYDLVTGRGTPKGKLIVESLVTLGSVSGVVFDDADGNGVQNSEPGLAGWTVYADLDADAVLDPVVANNFNSTDVPKAISSLGANTVTSDTVVSGLTGLVIDVNVTVNIDHNRLSDLVLTLIAPDSTRIVLADGVGGSGDDFFNTTFDDSAAISVTKGTAPFAGSYHPDEMLLDLFAKNPNGTWTLEVQDTTFGTGGTLTSWSLELTTGDPNSISAAGGAYYIDALPAGTYQIREVPQAPYVQTAPPGGFFTVNLAAAQHVASQNFGNQAPPSAIPSGVTLLAGSDTGASNSDLITRLNNASPGAALQFEVSGTVSGATVTVFADGTVIGTAVAGGSTTIVTTDGSTVVPDGVRDITARQTEPGKSQSSATAPLAIEIDTQAPLATLVPVTPDPRTTPVAQMTIAFDEEVSGLELGDLSLTYNAGGNLLTGAQSVTSGDGITWTLADLSGLTAAAGLYELILSPAGTPIEDIAGNVNSDIESTSFFVTAEVLNRLLFYNESAFDGNDPSIAASDDGAIAIDKSAYLPGAGTAVFENLSSYSRGINGIMIDLSGSHPSISANDFVFKVGNNNSPSTWGAAPAPSAISVRPGAGASGSDRIEITWAAGAIKGTWLEVQVLATAETGLAVPDVFFWGNLVGETTSPAAGATFTTNVSGDGAAILAGSPTSGVGITNLLDINRNNTVNVAGDRSEVVGNSPGSLLRINVSSGGPFTPEGGGGDSSSQTTPASPQANPATGQAIAPAASAAVSIGAPPAGVPTIEPFLANGSSGLEVPANMHDARALRGMAAMAAAWHGLGRDAWDALDEELLDVIARGRRASAWRRL